MDLIEYLPVILVVLQKLVCFILGYLTIRLGYKLINSGVKGEFKFSAEYHGVKGGLISSSPGLLFVLLGVLLIGFAIWVKKPYDISDEQNAGSLNKSSVDTIYTPPKLKDLSPP